MTKTHVLAAVAGRGVHVHAETPSATCSEPDRVGGETTVLSSRGTTCGLSEGDRYFGYANGRWTVLPEATPGFKVELNLANVSCTVYTQQVPRGQPREVELAMRELAALLNRSKPVPGEAAPAR